MPKLVGSATNLSIKQNILGKFPGNCINYRPWGILDFGKLLSKNMKALSTATLVLCLCLPTDAFALPQRRPPLTEVRYWIERLDSDHLVESWQLRGRTLKLTINEARWQEGFSSNRDFLLRALEQNLGVTVVPQSAHRKRLVEP